MSRNFDHGKAAYAKKHRNYDVSDPQHTRHYIGDNVMEHYGAKPSNYAAFSECNYRMGSRATNDRDRIIDNAFLGHVFHDAGHSAGYDPSRLAANGVTRNQQLQGIGARFDVAKEAYARTGEHKYYMMQKDLRDVALNHLDADGRGFRLSNK